MFRKLFENTITIIRAMEAAEDLEAALPSRVLALEAKLAALEDRLAKESPAASPAPSGRAGEPAMAVLQRA